MKIPSADQDPVARLLEIIANLRSPEGCPWDRKQTHESLLRHLLEESFETVDAVRQGDDLHLEEELGDVLLQIVLHAQIGSERGSFDFQSIARKLGEKMIRRHPHVFGDVVADTTDDVMKTWASVKKQERGGDIEKKPFLDGVGEGLPPLMRAAKLQMKVAAEGFDWDDVSGAVDKVEEELKEVKEELDKGTEQELEGELGDLLFSVVNICRMRGIAPEVALHITNQKFVSRYSGMEVLATEQGKNLKEMSLEEQDDLWNQVKLKERK